MFMNLSSVLIGHNMCWDKLTPLLVSIGQLNRKRENEARDENCFSESKSFYFHILCILLDLFPYIF